MMEDSDAYYIEVLLPLHIPGTYTYRVQWEMASQVHVGARVVVQFGQRHLYSALVRSIHHNAPQWPAKYIVSILDDHPIVSERQMIFWEWLSTYYMCYPGDVMQIALPAGLKLASESAISIHPDYDGDLGALSKSERMVVDLLTEHPVMRLDDISNALGIHKVMPLIRGMMERGIVIMDEELKERYKPPRATYISLSPEYTDELSQRNLFDELERKKYTKQVALLLQIMQLTDYGKKAVPKRSLPQSSSLQTLIKNGVLITEEREDSKIIHYSAEEIIAVSSIVLNQYQSAAFDKITSRDVQATTLLHGVTSSGKTEVYIKLIDREIKAGHQVLLLLPEIALTSQVVNRLRRYFGDLVGVYHSRFSSNQRIDVWRRTYSNGDDRYQVLLGARSAIFLPFTDLSLVIVDEEHDTSYKQVDPAPRYNARDAAIYLASLWNAKTVLGSATPSIESYSNAISGKYGLAVMSERYGGYTLPKVEVIDMKSAAQKGELKGHFSNRLLTAIGDALADNKQVILFQNRRGFSLRVECDDCHYIPQCINCDVSLVYHKATSSLRCHYCGYSIPVPNQCPACKSTHLRMTGVGTERIEEDLQIIFPDAHVARLDLDSTSQKNRYNELITSFSEHEIDILVGTQMVTKGLDFHNVSVVGVVNADNLINYPNFRSFERAFQQLTQVSGRAGRHSEDSSVIIQTYNPNHQVLQNVMDSDYSSMFHDQDIERRVFRYPPYYRLIEVVVRDKQQAVVNEAAEWFANRLKAVFGNRVMGPEYPLVSRVRGLYIKTIVVRFERSEPIPDAKHIMLQMADELHNQHQWRKVLVHFDVDPY